MTPARVIDAFAGAGGFSLGFQLAGCEVVGAIERDAWAAETFAFNAYHERRLLLRTSREWESDTMFEQFGQTKPTILVEGATVKASRFPSRGRRRD